MALAGRRRRGCLFAEDDLGEVLAEDDLGQAVVVGRAIRPRGSPDPAVLADECQRAVRGASGEAIGEPVGDVGQLVVLTDADAYRAYDQDEEHNRARAGLLPMTEQIARVQFEMP